MSAESRHLRMLLLGQSGSGKTRLAVTTAPPGGIYVVVGDIGDATASARGRGREFDESPLVDTAAKLETALKTATAGAVEGRYRTVVFDTLSEYARATLDAELAANPGNSQRAFGEMGRRVMSTVTRMIKQVPAHLVFVAHAAFDESGDTELDIPGQSGRRVPALLNDVWLLRAAGGKRVLTRRPGGVLKSRTVADDCLECEPSLVALLDKMTAGTPAGTKQGETR